jgi:hypothetical protein
VLPPNARVQLRGRERARIAAYDAAEGRAAASPAYRVCLVCSVDRAGAAR